MLSAFNFKSAGKWDAVLEADEHLHTYLVGTFL